jgi:membrane protein required for colicin V production
MAVYDIVVLAVLGFTVLLGFYRGLIRQIASIVSIVVGYMAAMSFREPLSKAIPAEAPWNKIAAMAILFLATSLVVWIIYSSLSSSLKKMELKGFDHQAGAVFGGIKGLLLCCIGTMFAVSLLGSRVHQSIHASKSGHFVVSTIHQLAEYLPIVPVELRTYLDPQFERFNQAMGSTSDNPAGFKYPASEQGKQNPFTVPQYQGKWNRSGRTNNSESQAVIPTGDIQSAFSDLTDGAAEAAAEAAARATTDRFNDFFNGRK